MKLFLKLLVGISLWACFALPVWSMEPNVTYRRMTKEDFSWALSMGLQHYMDIYFDKAFYVRNKSEDLSAGKYTLLSSGNGDVKEQILRNDAKRLLESYFKEGQNTLDALVFSMNGKNLGGIFYRKQDGGVLVIDEAIFEKSVSMNVRKFIMTILLSKIEPTCRTHKVFIRPINEEDLSFFNSLRFKLEDEEKYNYDPLLYIALSKTYE
jgi:hypothetical protein